jgi:two-component system CheB/CheR fusion protein
MEALPTPEKLNILLVDDQPAKLLAYEAMLADLGENLIKASTASAALERLLQGDIAIVLMDVSMPDIDGFELATMIRQHPRCTRTAIIFVSAVHLTDLDRIKGYETGGLDYVPVPVVPGLLRAKIGVIADLHRKRVELQTLADQLEARVAERTAALEASTARLAASEERFRTLAERMPHLVWEADATGGTTYHNQRFYDYTGAQAEQCLGEGWLSFVHPEDRGQLADEWQRALASPGAHALDLELRLRRGDGAYRWFRLNGEPARDAGGAVIRWVGTSTDVEEQRRAEAGLRDADRRKDEFLATLAHELRNPLAPIRNAVELLRAEGSADAALTWGRDVIERQVVQLTRLVDDLLDVSRISRGKIKLQLEPLDLSTAVSGAIETSRPSIDARGHRLRLVACDEHLWLAGDLVRLTQAIANLLNNASKFQALGGEIELGWKREGNDAVVWVADRGIGIEESQLERVFDLFAQVETPLGNTEGGLGIGLSLVKSLVELHGGTVVAQSEGRARGSVFTIRLPLLPNGVRVGGPQVHAVDAEPERSEKTRILVVDDNRDAAQTLALLLRQRGYDALIAYDGERALEIAKSARPRIVLLDLGLPELDGFEVCRRLRRPGYAQSVVIAVTGYGQEEDRQRATAAGFDEYLVKPVDPAKLLQVLANAGRGAEG